MKKSKLYFIVLVIPVILVPASINVPADYNTIQEAIVAAVTGDTIIVGPGTYTETINYSGKDLVIKSTDGPEQTIIDGNKAGSVVSLISGETKASKLEGFTIKNGSGDATVKPGALLGGGILVRFESGITLRNLIVTDNTATGTESAGGGISVGLGSMVDIDSCIITNNISYWGGGLCNLGSDVNISHSKIFGNKVYSSTNEGGGAGFFAGSDATMSVFCVTINNNTSAVNGGAIWIDDQAYLKLLSTTITNNYITGTGYGGGVVVTNNSDIDIVNTILWNNAKDDLWSWTAGDLNTVRISYSDIDSSELSIDSGELQWLNGNIDSDPTFVDVSIGNFMLADGSPCIDKGTLLQIIDGDTILDMRDHSYNGEAPDIGAVEWFSTLNNSPETNIPVSYELGQNYPNPFNPSTRISYTVSENTDITLTVYDLLGNKIATLFEGRQSIGRHNVTWDGFSDNGSKVPAGIYIYQLVTQNSSISKKMILLK